jgi:dipeptidyl-peptidase-4
MKNIYLLFFLATLSFQLVYAQNTITLEDLWASPKYQTKSVPGFSFLKDGKHYSRTEEGKIVAYDITTDKQTGVIFDAKKNKELEKVEDFGYQFSADENKILLEMDAEQIYRHSYRANYYVWDKATGNTQPVFGEGKIRYATFSPDGTKVAFEHANDMYVKDLGAGTTTRITEDGKANHIINGAADWVYEEEFSFSRAFEWSPDSRKIAFIRFDESEVPEYTMQLYANELYPLAETFKYPKVGEKNAVVSVHIYDLATGKTARADTGTETDIYLPRIKWTQDPNSLCITRLNRHQNKLELLLANAQTGTTKQLLEEENQYYVDIHDNLTFLKDGKHFLWTSEMDGYNHIYLYNMNGKKLQQITKGDWEVTSFYGLDEAAQTLYYQSTEKSPMERQIYATSLKGKDKKAIAGEKGWNDGQFSSTFQYLILEHSDANTPPVYTVVDNKGKVVRPLEDNKTLKQRQADAKVRPIEFINFKTSEGVSLNAWVMKPYNFDQSKKYPLLMYEYGGPGSQQVTDQWKYSNYWWFELLAQKGYMVACVDNRGTGGRGEAFKKMTYLQLGKYETIDQIEGAKYFGSLPYVDAQRIGIFGWSYGGFLSSLCILKGNDVFKAAIAVAPVTSWRWYDTIYTERFMRTETENPNGYKDNSPVYFADRLKGNYLLVHGTADDNVHFQNTVEMANALINNNKQFDTYFYPNKNHGIYGGYARLHLFSKMTNFLMEKL